MAALDAPITLNSSDALVLYEKDIERQDQMTVINLTIIEGQEQRSTVKRLGW